MSGEVRTPAALRDVERLYTGNIAEKGVDPKSVGWRDEAAQRLRFEKLAYVIDRDAAAGGATYNDLGCGYGAMFPFLRDAGGIPLRGYRGYDISAAMLAAARERHTDGRADFVEADRIQQAADYSFVSGTFHVKCDAPEDDWREYVVEMLRNVAAHTTRGFAFNLVTSYVDYREPQLYYADPSFFTDFCIRNFSRRVALLHDYPLWEFTIAVTL